MTSTTKKSSSRNNNGSALKQGTLAFSSAKRTNSHTTTKTKGPPPARRSSSLIEKQRIEDEEIHNEEDSYDVLEISSEEEYSPASVKRSGDLNVTKASKSSSVKRLKDEPPAVKPAEKWSSLDVSDKNFRKLYGQVREKMGHLEPIHAEGQNKIHQILRVFDMSYEYGPCVGMTRLERWERAASFGLNPPEEVRQILSTREGVEMDEYSQCVLYGEV
ncbi:DNA polymerase delta, subunit 4-domain-containing protein [Suillus clintonianus]|uniref:DNA polymerase delta, subunit 4-domain-containing protein n=1 Tax=Suillus clintonianus TaxID=1904413 RepID=UPI001B85E18C|nr:DNA polymerase delta, subunit 4-domain-containing protein [Suillus clintonianus]KAG2144344.1 DNA polymerase delta, subunit 4-domain-containing protein [Suillus clintonianus]